LLHSCAPDQRLTTDTCEVRIEKLVEVKGDEVGSAPVALVTPDRILLVRLFAYHEIAVFDRRGRFIRIVGRQGEGPGEFQAISALVALPDGGIAAFDPTNLRMTYFSPDLTAWAEYRIPVRVSRFGPVRLPDGGWVLPGNMGALDLMGSPFVRVDSAGRIQTYYTQDENESETNPFGRADPRRLAFHPRFGVVSIKQFDYHLEFWNEDGTRSGTYAPEVDWFEWPPAPSPDPHSFIGEPEDRFYGIQFDEEGRLWSLAQIEGEDWESGIENGQVVDKLRWIDFRIEVLDLESHRVLCAKRVTEQLFSGGFSGPGIIHSYAEDWLGNPTVTFWQLSLEDS
jgi:hypothetical protein